MRLSVSSSLTVTALIGALLALTASFGSGVASAETSGDSGTIAGGDNFSCAVADGGEVRCWGANTHGQLGDGTLLSRSEPTPVVGIGAAALEISGGWQHTCTLTTAGGAKCWGLNASGQLGNGTTTTPQLTPTDVVGLASGVDALSAGLFHTCALTDAGGVKCWGDNANGELGDGTTTASSTPVDVVGLTSGVVAIAAGGGISCAITDTGALKCWGDNASGGVGDGTTTDRLTPTDVIGMGSGVAAVSAESTHPIGSRTCAVTDTGAAKCWGTNNQGQLGDGTFTNRSTPVDVVGLSSGVVSVTTGSSQTCALIDGGGAKCWGQWAVGAGLDGIQTTPVDVVGLTSGVAELQAGGFHTCALDTAGGVLCWGGNASGQLGIGTTGGRQGLIPQDVSGSFHRPECPTLIAQEHTDFGTSNGYAVGSVATFFADPGYSVVGPAALTCQADLSFDGGPPAATPTTAIVVTPSTGLHGGDVVELSLSGFAPGATVGWCQAVADAPLSAGNCATPISFGTTDADGALSTSATVTRFMYAPGPDRWADCADPSETCVFGAADILDINGSAAIVALDIITPPPPTTRGDITLTPSRVSGSGATVVVTGTGFRPDARIEIFQCVNGATDPSGCNSAFGVTNAGSSGGFSLDLVIAASVVPAGTTATACFDPTGACIILAAESSDFPGTAASRPVELVVPPPVVLPGGAMIVEGHSAVTTMLIPVTLDHEHHEVVQVPWTTIFSSSWDETLRADPGVDYRANSGTVTFAAGETEATVAVEILGDVDLETTELLVVSFAKPSNAGIGGYYGLAFGAIVDDDHP